MKTCAIVSALILFVLLLFGCAALVLVAMSVPTVPAVNTPTPEAGCEIVEDGKVCIGDISYEGGTIALAVQVENHTGRNLLISREQITLQTADGRTVAHDQQLSLDTWGEFGGANLAPSARWSIGIVFVVPAGETVEAVVYSGFADDVTLPLTPAP